MTSVVTFWFDERNNENTYLYLLEHQKNEPKILSKLFFPLDRRNTKKIKNKMLSFYKQRTYSSQIILKKSNNNNIIFYEQFKK